MDELDRILAAEDGIEPSSGFADAVNRAIASDAEDRALRLPWGRWAVGMAACLVLAAAGSALLWPAVQSARVALQPLAASWWPLTYGAVAAAGSLALAVFPTWRHRFAG
jgi:hypothetical protein